MTKEDYFLINDGPSRYDLLMSLFEGKVLTFVKSSQKKVSSVSKFVVNGLQKDGSGGVNNDCFNLEILIISDTDPSVSKGEPLLASYNCHLRFGCLKSRSKDFFDLDVSKDMRLYPSRSNSKTIMELVSEGRYDCVDKGIDENIFIFDVEFLKRDNYLCKYLNFNHEMSPSNAINEMQKCGFKPGDFMDLLLFGKDYPDEQVTHFPILAIGSTVINKDSQDCFLCLSYNDGIGLRELCLVPVQEIFEDDYKYLVVPK